MLEEDKIQIELRYLQTEIKRIKEATENFKSRETPGTIVRSGQIPVEITMAEYKEMISALNKAYKDLELRIAETNSTVREAKRLNWQLNFVYALAVLSFLAGYRLANYGSRNWYDRV